MKKSKVRVKFRSIHKEAKFNTFSGLGLVIITAIVGIVALTLSHAQGGAVSFTVRVINTANNGVLPGVQVSLEGLGAPDNTCGYESGYGTIVTSSTPTVTTNSQGLAVFGPCQPSPPAVYELKGLSISGYHVAPNSPYKPGNDLPQAGGQVDAYMQPNDSDGDGVPDLSDACPNQAASTSNGCPTPAPPPTVKNPSPTPPPATTKKTTTSSPASAPPPAPAIVKATSGDTTAPSSPSNLKAVAKDSKVLLSWEGATDNVGVVSYSIERSTISSDWAYLTTSNSTTSYTDSSVLNTNTQYSYRVRAVDAAGNQSEAVYGDASITGNSSGTDTASSSQPAKVSTKKSNAGKTALKIGGTVLVLAAIGGGIVTFLKWRAARALAIDDQIRNTTVENAIHTVEPTAPHQAESLKEMVMHDAPHDQGPK
jgi:hypothetical protein